MENQENILDLYYNKHLKQKDIATIVGVSKQYVSKVIKADSRCKEEKQIRKDNNAIKEKINEEEKQHKKELEELEKLEELDIKGGE